MKKSVLVIGTGTIGEPLIGLLSDFREEMGVHDVYFYKRTPLLDEVPKVNSLIRRGAKLVTTDTKVAETFEKIGNVVSSTFSEVLEHTDVVIDCTPAGNENKEFYYYDRAYRDGLATESPMFIAQGSEKGFGKPYAYGINDDSLKEKHKTDKFVQVVSCNTHNIACLIKTISGGDDILDSDFVCIRRANDVSQEGNFVAAPTVGKHSDKTFGTHHARDVFDLLSTVGMQVPVYSSAMKTNSQYMHTIRFSITISGDATLEQITERLEENRFVALTLKKCSNKVFSFGRDHGYYGRTYNQAVVSTPSLQVRNIDDATIVTGYCFTPQDGNSLLSSLAATAYGLYGDGYEDRLEFVNDLLFDRV
jgi:glyceraldehyde-3-phosphate dehydrogenase type II